MFNITNIKIFNITIIDIIKSKTIIKSKNSQILDILTYIPNTNYKIKKKLTWAKTGNFHSTVNGIKVFVANGYLLALQKT